jgi:mono/diheme cytochrome c family protein
VAARAALAAALLLLAGCRGDDAGPGGPDPRAGTAADPATLLMTDSERRGEAIFKRENCGRCHSLFATPPAEGDALRPGPPVEGPLGSRVGPDLGAEGHRHSDDWHYAHLYGPTLIVASSRMPPSRHLFRPEGGRPVPTAGAVDLVAYLQALGRGRRDIWAEWRRREPAVSPPSPADRAAARQRGDDLYREHCAGCHGLRGDGRGAAASLLLTPPRDFTAGRFRFTSRPGGAPAADAELFRSLTLGTGTGAAMPAFEWLPAADRWALVGRVQEFSAVGTVSEVAPPASATVATGAEVAGADGANQDELARGRALWQELECATCHGERGQGMTRQEARADWSDETGAPIPRSSDLRHACGYKAGASDAAVERSIAAGLGPGMPAYGGSLPDPADRRALILFLRSLEQEPER